MTEKCRNLKRGQEEMKGARKMGQKKSKKDGTKKEHFKKGIGMLLTASMLFSNVGWMGNADAVNAAEENGNVALGKKVTVSKGGNEAEAQRITDGIVQKDWQYSYRYRSEAESEDKEDKPYVTIDLGEKYDINKIKYFGVMPPDYPGYYNISHNMVIQVSNDKDFKDDSTKTVFNTDQNNFFGFGAGSDQETKNTTDGILVEFEETEAQYVRYYQHGASQLPTPGKNCHPNALTACEIEVYEADWELPPSEMIPEGNLVYGAEVTGSEFNSKGEPTNGWWGGWSNNDLNEICNGNEGSDHWKGPTDNVGGMEGESTYLTIDLKKATEMSTIKIWNKTPNTYLSQIVQVSENGTDWHNVYNSDKNNRAGQDPSDSGKTVCGGKLQNGTITGKVAGADEAYQEMSSGKTIDFEKTNARYIRWWCSGHSQNPMPQMIQLQAFNRHVVTFDYNDGSGRTDTMNVDNGCFVSRPEDPISAEIGMLFDKWTVNEANGEEWDFATPVTGDMKLVANWKKVGYSTVTFDTDLGTAIEPVKVTNGLAITKPKNPEKENKVFAGWKLDGAPYNFSKPITKDITLKATWVEPATPNAETIQAGTLKIVLDSHGNVTNLINTLDGKDYFNLKPDDKVRSLVSLVAEYNIETPTSVTYDETTKEFIFGFASINAEAIVVLKDNGNYTSLTLKDVKKPEGISVQAVLWGPIKTTFTTGGQTVGTVYDEEYAIGMHMLNEKTIGGWPIEFDEDSYPSDLPPLNGYTDPRCNRNYYTSTAAFSTWGSVLHAYTWDYTKDTMRTTRMHTKVPQMQPAMTGPRADKLASIIGSSVALYGTRTDNVLNVISNIELTEELPRPTINGKWQKESIETMQDFLVFNDSIWGQVENDSKMANAAGIKVLYGQYGASGPWKSDGSYEFNGHFGGSDENAKKMVEEAAKYGATLGVHTLTNLISYHDPKATPEATDMLAYAGFAPLTRDISATDTTIYVKEGLPFSDEVVNDSGGRKEIRIGKEFITFSKCSQVSENEWALTGCARGGNGTTAAAHKANDNVYKLWHYYGSLVGGWESVDPVMNRLDTIFNEIGIHNMSYDSFESTHYSVYGTILPTLYMNDVYYNNLKAGNADGFITEASHLNSNGWDVQSRLSLGESNTPLNLIMNNIAYYRQNFLPSMLGWSYDHGNHGGYSEPNLLMNLAMKGGWNAGTGWYVNRNTFNQYPYMPEMIKTWNNAIQHGAFVVNGDYTEEVQSQLRAAWENGKVWTLTEVVPDEEWTLQEVNKSNLDEKIGEPITLTATDDINIDREAIENGDIATDVSREYSREHSGNEVTVYTQAYTGYELDEKSLEVVAEDGTKCEVTPIEGEDGVYTFTMPEQDVDITAEFVAQEEPEEPSKANKELLQKTYDYALTLDTDGVTDSAKAFFGKVLAEAKAVLDDADATQEEVNIAWSNLVEGIHRLGIVKGDTAMLELLVERAEAMMKEQDRYVQDKWNNLVTALDAAKKLLADSGDATPDVVEKATDDLLKAILEQRYKANKENLKDLINKAEGLDLSKYTEKSVKALKKALAKANDIYADDSLSTDNQKKVDKAAKELEDAINGLQLVSNAGDDNGGNAGNDSDADNGNSGTSGDGNTTTDTGKDAPKTGDSMNVAVWLMLMAAVAVAAGVSVKRRRKL